jgi:hypothetical protein
MRIDGHIFEGPLDIFVAFLVLVIPVVTVYTIVDAIRRLK